MTNTWKKTALCLLLLLVACLGYGEVKYVFYMIGDGMGCNQVLAAEMYSAALKNEIGRHPLWMTQFPVTGQLGTFSASNGITDSAAAGTALATGSKTRNGMLGMNADSVPVRSIAEKLHQAGWPIGIMTTVPLDDATPAAFYAHQNSRKNYYHIGRQLAESEYDFFGGAGFRKPENKSEWKAPNLYDLCEKNEYTIARGYKDALAKLDAKRMLLVQDFEAVDRTQGANSLPYAIDRRGDELTLTQITDAAIRFLLPRGRFFIMFEGGLIDWAGHSRDGATDIQEVLDFNETIRLVLDFYEQHPDETLIVVTADHETGGMALGNSDYTLNLQVLQHQHASLEQFNNLIQKMYDEYGKKLSWKQVQKELGIAFGFYDAVSLTYEEDAQLQEAWKKLVKTNPNHYKDLRAALPGIGKTAVRILNDKAKLGWTTYAHTASPVPVFAKGVGAEYFAGWFDNTEVAPRIMQVVTGEIRGKKTRLTR